MVLDFRKVRVSEAVVAISGIALVVVISLVDWFALRATTLDGTMEAGRNGFQSFSVTDLVVLLAALAAIALPPLVASSSMRNHGGRVDWAVAALGVLAIALLLIRIISVPDLGFTTEGYTVYASDYPEAEVIRRAGVWLGLALSIVIAAAAAKAGRGVAARP